MAYMRDSAGRRLDSSIAERVRNQTIVYIGDSLTADAGYAPDNKALTGAPNRSYLPNGFATWAQILSGHRLQLLANLGVGGRTTAQILNVIDDVIELAPGYVHELSGTNNTGSDALLAQAKADKAEMWDRYETAGIRVFTGSLFPIGTYTTELRRRYDDLNEWIRQEAERRENVILVDYFSVLAGWGGEYEIGYNRDTTHTNPTGASMAGRLFANVLNQMFPPRRILSSAQGDSANLATAGRFGLGGSGALPTGWSTPNLSGSAFSKEARTDRPGSWQVITVANGANGLIQHNMPVNGTTLAVGDWVEAAVEFDVTNLDAAAASKTRGFYLRLQSFNGSTATDLNYAPYFVATSTDNHPAFARSGIMLTPPIQVPAGTTALLGQIGFGGGGTYKLDRFTVRNLTKLGLPTNLG